MRDGYPHGVPCFIDTEQPDRQAAADFYGALFGWEIEDRGRYLMGRLDGADVAGVGAQLTHATAAWHTYVCVDSADAAAARVRSAGGSVLRGPQDLGAAGRVAVCADPAGAGFRVWEPRERHGAELVNAPGAWNWSTLSTRDPAGAKAFYSAVFGWEVKAGMWRLPGHGDALAGLLPIDGVGVSRWSVTFAAANTDATAALASDLGGTVLVEPHDDGPVRAADLRDPQGATFSVKTVAS
jgi:predicted enzyme related to lactoylglutathione lyase